MLSLGGCATSRSAGRGCVNMMGGRWVARIESRRSHLSPNKLATVPYGMLLIPRFATRSSRFLPRRFRSTGLSATAFETRYD